MPAVKDPWADYAGMVLKDLMRHKRLNYKDLSKLLSEIGVYENARQLTNKINRGLFPFSLFLQCIAAMKLGLSDVPWAYMQEHNPVPVTEVKPNIDTSQAGNVGRGSDTKPEAS